MRGSTRLVLRLRRTAGKRSRPHAFYSSSSARASSAFYEALTDQAVQHGIRHVTSPRPGVDDPTIEVDDFVYDIDIDQPPTSLFDALKKSGRADCTADPFSLVAGEVGTLSDGIKALLGSDHPVLESAAKYFFEVDGGKKVRPTMVLLMSHACNADALATDPGFVLERYIQGKQLRLAEISEMIHTASLFHDDVIDKADTRRGVPALNKIFGNKLAILAGDFLLARSTASLARLRCVRTVEIMSTIIEHLVKGEVLQLRPTLDGLAGFEYYSRKNYYKTASLMANCCKAAAVLGGHSDAVQGLAHTYGKRIGLAFQLVDDVLDFEGTSQSLGKPALNDIRQGLSTAPVLLAAEGSPELQEMMARKFCAPGDVDAAVQIVHNSGSIKHSRAIAMVQAELAMEAALQLAPSPERDALIVLAHRVVNRSH